MGIKLLRIMSMCKLVICKGGGLEMYIRSISKIRKRTGVRRRKRLGFPFEGA